jgi:3-oxoacyl-[acyl-carrier protein] reductase
MTYNAVKASMNSWSKSLARQLAKDGIMVNVVAPGSVLFPGGSWERRQRENPVFIENFVRTEMPLGRFGKPEEIAAMVTFLASERASLMTGGLYQRGRLSVALEYLMRAAILRGSMSP